MRIIESITKNGIKATAPSPDGVIHSAEFRIRLQTPSAGDPVQWKDGSIGRIEKLQKNGRYHVCEQLGSAYMEENYISISGGPFREIKVEDLEPTYNCIYVQFWTWPDGAGAGKGVHFRIARPLFRYIGE